MDIRRYIPRAVHEAAFIASDVLGIRNPNPNRPDSLLRATGRIATNVVMLPVVALFAIPVFGAPLLLIGGAVGVTTNCALSAAATALGADPSTAAHLGLYAGVTAGGIAGVATCFGVAEGRGCEQI